MTAIMCSIPHPNDATSKYRGIGPFQTLKRRHRDIDIIINQELNWVTLKGVDVVFFQRPALDDRLGALKLCKLNKKKVWVDYDDNLHAIPLCNRRYPTYGHPHIQHNLATMVALADIVTVSTDHLKESMIKLIKCFPDNGEYILNPDKVVTIPNAYDYELLPLLKDKREPRARRVVWRGSDSHCKDLMTHTEQLVNVTKANQDWVFEYIGEPLWWTMERLKEVTKPQVVQMTPPMDPVNFFQYLWKQRPELIIVPLEDQAFNKSKSNIAWIEGTAAGAITLAPAWPEWSKPGVITYDGVADFETKFESVLHGAYDTEMLWRQSRDYIMEHLQLDTVNRLRLQVLDRLGQVLS